MLGSFVVAHDEDDNDEDDDDDDDDDDVLPRKAQLLATGPTGLVRRMNHLNPDLKIATTTTTSAATTLPPTPPSNTHLLPER
jgi:hypothetical protein